MDRATGKFLTQGCVDHLVLLDSTLTGKRRRRQLNAEVVASTRRVDDVTVLKSNGCAELGFDVLRSGHQRIVPHNQRGTHRGLVSVQGGTSSVRGERVNHTCAMIGQ